MKRRRQTTKKTFVKKVQQKKKYEDCTHDMFFLLYVIITHTYERVGALFGGRKPPGRRLRPRKQNRSFFLQENNNIKNRFIIII